MFFLRQFTIKSLVLLHHPGHPGRVVLDPSQRQKVVWHSLLTLYQLKMIYVCISLTLKKQRSIRPEKHVAANNQPGCFPGVRVFALCAASQI